MSVLCVTLSVSGHGTLESSIIVELKLGIGLVVEFVLIRQYRIFLSILVALEVSNQAGGREHKSSNVA